MSALDPHTAASGAYVYATRQPFKSGPALELRPVPFARRLARAVTLTLQIAAIAAAGTAVTFGAVSALAFAAGA